MAFSQITRNPESPAFKALQLEFLRECVGADFPPELTHIPAGIAGDWEVRYAFDEEHRLIYQELLHQEQVVADNHPNSLKRHEPFLNRARGSLFISGLGVGETLFALLRNSASVIEHIRVLERHQEVIDLIAPVLDRFPAVKAKVTLEKGNIFHFEPAPKERYDCVYHTIWHRPEEMTPEQVAALRRKFARHCGWMGLGFDAPATLESLPKGEFRR